MFDHEAGMPPQDRTHRVYVSFQCRDGWHCHFLEADLQTSLLKRLHFATSDKVVELIKRAGGFTDQETRLMVNQGIEMGRGGIFLRLTEAQYAALRKR